MLEKITSDAITHPHGFFTRIGGASTGIYSGLNCGRGSNDHPDHVTHNRALVATAMGVTPDHLVGVHQIHSADVVTITKPLTTAPKADALVTKTPGIALGILTADCQPVLFSDPNAGVIGAAHAGWKGACIGVLQNTVDAMVNLGADCRNITATIGPCISQTAYEVGPEFFDNILTHHDDAHQFFANGDDGRYQFNLPAFGLAQLRAAGLTDVAWTGHCTYADPARFYSYRKSVHESAGDYGRLIATITLG